MLEYINIVISRILSMWSYTIFSLSQKWWWEQWIVEYVLFFVIAYLFFIVILHKIYHFLVKSYRRQKTNYFFACDNLIYTYQHENISQTQDIQRIETIIKDASYDKSYNLFLDKAKTFWWDNKDILIKNIKNTHKKYINSSRRKSIYWMFLTIITLGIYSLFIEN